MSDRLKTDDLPMYELIRWGDNGHPYNNSFYASLGELLSQISDEAVVMWDDFINKTNYSIPYNIIYINLIISAISIAQLRLYTSSPYTLGKEPAVLHSVFQYDFMPDLKPEWVMIWNHLRTDARGKGQERA
jgi:hypothetical protein